MLTNRNVPAPLLSIRRLSHNVVKRPWCHFQPTIQPHVCDFFLLLCSWPPCQRLLLRELPQLTCDLLPRPSWALCCHNPVHKYHITRRMKQDEYERQKEMSERLKIKCKWDTYMIVQGERNNMCCRCTVGLSTKKCPILWFQKRTRKGRVWVSEKPFAKRERRVQWHSNTETILWANKYYRSM